MSKKQIDNLDQQISDAEEVLALGGFEVAKAKAPVRNVPPIVETREQRRIRRTREIREKAKKVFAEIDSV